MDDILHQDAESDQISQDDIDRLLRGVSEESVAVEEPVRRAGPAAELVSLDEIERLLDLALEKAEEIEETLDAEISDEIRLISRSPGAEEESGSGGAAAAAEETGAGSDSGLISQSDIDQLFGGGEVSEPLLKVEEPPAADSGVVSQSDIDRLLSGVEEESGSGGAVAESDTGLISQSDIDQLFGGGGASEPLPKVEEPPAADSGVVSPSEIDRLLSGAEEESGSGGAVAESDTGLISQSDIDQLFGGGGASEPLPKVEEPPAADSGMVTQSDIDQLLAGINLENTEIEIPKTAQAGEPIPSLVTQADIDQLLMSYHKSGTLEEQASATEDAGLILTQDEINRLLLEAKPSGTETAPVEEEEARSNFITQAELDELLAKAAAKKKPLKESPTKAAGESGLISQDEIDSLMLDQGDEDKSMGPKDRADTSDIFSQDDIDGLFQDESGPKTVALKAEIDSTEIISQDDIERLLQDEGGTEILPTKAESDTTEIISQDDIDRLLRGEDNVAETVALKKGLEETEIISQDDIDRLLGGEDGPGGSIPAGGMSTGEEEIISQDDIDQLLREVDEEAPVQPVQKAKERPKKDLVSQDEIDRLLQDDLGAAEESKPEEPAALPQEPVDRVILAEKEETALRPLRRPWYRSKYMALAASILLVILASTGGYHYFRGKKTASQTGMQTEVAVKSIPKPPPAQKKKPPVMAHDFKIELKGFVVFAPPGNEKIAFITADVIIDLQKTESANEIIRQEAFFRSIVYSAISKEFFEKEAGETDPEQLKKVIKEALNRALKAEAVSKVELNDFRTV